ncbi:hypothetical protein TWF481_010515 [Arthrobotrys musiformis]|uniref:Receptor L-domain domain-containing protein n=1 Tax=Arthrobotrys musiformis TaxID=47236 RepID=A0AAV9W0Z3_9PEZI
MRFKTPKLSLISLLTIINIITRVHSQSTTSANCTAELLTINSQSELDALSSCVTLSGSINFGRDIVNATINGIQTIRGALRVTYGAKVQRLIAPDLSFVGGILQISGALNLTVLSMPSLANVGSLRFEYLPRLRTVEFSSQIDSLGDDTAIQLVVWDTAIESLADIIYRKVESVQIIENPNMVEVDLPIRNITGVFVVRDNGNDTRVSLPYLGTVGYVHMGANVGEVNLPNLTAVETDVRITSDYLRRIELPGLVNIGTEKVATTTRRASLEINRSKNLTAVSFPKLEWIMSDLRINGSEGWTELGGFPVLGSVGDDVVIDGDFENINLPNLRPGDGESRFWINSPQVDCAALLREPIFTEGGWRTNVTCNGGLYDLSPEEETKETKKSLSGGAIGGIAVGAVAAVGGALILFFVCFRRRRVDLPKILELEDGGISKRKVAELPEAKPVAELEDPETSVAPELEGSIPLAELEASSSPNQRRAPEHEVSIPKPPLEQK